ncbi:MAG: hypothetical protein ABW061_06050 [Polyangiaceae bacterium]
MTWRIALVSALIPATLGASSLLVACNDDVDTPPWYPNYTDSGYGGKKATAGAGGASGAAGASGAGGSTSGGGGTSGAGGANAGSSGSSEAGEAGAT